MTALLPARAEGPLRVLVAYSYSVHYRRGVFEALLDLPDVDVTVAAGVTPPDGRGSASATVAPIDPRDVPALQWHRTFSLGPLRFQPGLLRRSLSSRYDVVIWDPSIYCVTMWVSSAVLRIRQRTVLYWGLGWTRTHSRPKEALKVAGFRLAHAFLTYGQRSAELAVAAGYPSDRVYVIGNSVKDSPAAAAVAAQGLPAPEPLVLGIVVRLTERKGVDLLIRAVDALNRQGVPTRAVIAGDGPTRASLEDLRDELGVDVSFTGALYGDEEIADFYKDVHITVLPSHAGLTVTSSLMHGRPVITHDNPEHHGAEWEAITQGLSGDFFAEHDQAGLTQAITDMAVRLQTGAAQRDAIARACREDYLRHGDPRAHAARIMEAVQDVIVQRFQRSAPGVSADPVTSRRAT